MFRILIFAILLFIIFMLAYKFLVNMFNSRMQKRIHMQHQPETEWQSIYRPIGSVLAGVFTIIGFFMYSDGQYLMTLVAAIFVAMSIWVYRNC